MKWIEMERKNHVPKHQPDTVPSIPIHSHPCPIPPFPTEKSDTKIRRQSASPGAHQRHELRVSIQVRQVRARRGTW